MFLACVVSDVPAPAPIDLDQPVGGSLKGNETQFVTVPIPPEQPPVTTVTITSQDGDLGFFASFSFPNPNAALNDASGDVRSGETVQFLVTDEQASGSSSTAGGRRRKRRDATSGQAPRQLYISIIAKSETAQFLMQAQAGNLIVTTVQVETTQAAEIVASKEQAFSAASHLRFLNFLDLIALSLAAYLATYIH